MTKGQNAMTEPHDESRPESHLTSSGDHSLRQELLRDLSGGECLSLSHVDSVVAYDHPEEPLAVRQLRVMTTVEALVTEGLLMIGDIVGGGNDHVNPWKVSTKDALSQMGDLYVTRYDNEPGWGWTVWFALTPEGERVASEIT
jgi:hypothetical protein